MDAIRSAIYHLENSSTVKKSQKSDHVVRDAVSQLSSTVALIELSTASLSTFTRLSELLRRRLLPLYRTSFILTLNCSVEIFLFIRQKKLPPNHQAKELRRSWEAVLESLLSGILDFLEENITSKHREAVASAFYPVLCPVFFNCSNGNPVDFDEKLLSTVYQLLMTTAESSAKNASRLRDSDIGSKPLGLTIAQTKEFLAIESLLELFALLIPPLKSGREKRTQFIAEVFDPSLFKCSEQIIGCLEDISNPDWSVTSAEIVKALAESDVDFPQPLGVVDFVLNGIKMDLSSFYVDRVQFIASLDMDGKIETLQVPFSTVRNIYGAPSSKAEARITLSVSEPPIMGDKPINDLLGGDHSLAWSLERKALERLRNVLTNRHLDIELSAKSKQSKAEEINLDFHPNQKVSSTFQKDKIQSLSQLWQAGASANKDKEVPTSPLAPGDSSRFSNTGSDPIQLEINISDTVFVHSDGGLSFAPKDIDKDVPKLIVRSPIKGVSGDDSEDDIPRPKSKVLGSRKRIINLSDSEADDGDDNDHQPFAKVNTNATYLSPIDVDKLPSPPPRKARQAELFTGSVEFTEKLRNIHQARINNRDEQYQKENNDILHDDQKPKDNLKKRKIGVVTDKTLIGKEEGSPIKRHRIGPATRIPLSPLHSGPINQYGRKGRVSSPALVEVNFDEVPPLAPMRESRKSQMKDKSGHSLPKPKSAPTKKVVKDQKPFGFRDRMQQPIETDADITLAESKDVKIDQAGVEEINDHVPKRRSSRLKGIQRDVIEKSRKSLRKQDHLPQQDILNSVDNIETGSKSSHRSIKEEKQMRVPETPSNASDDWTQTKIYNDNRLDRKTNITQSPPNLSPCKPPPNAIIDNLPRDKSHATEKQTPEEPSIRPLSEEKRTALAEDSLPVVAEPSATDDAQSPNTETMSQYFQEDDLSHLSPLDNAQERRRQYADFDLLDDVPRPRGFDRETKSRNTGLPDRSRQTNHIYHGGGIKPTSHYSRQQQTRRNEPSECPMDKIALILREINQAVIQNVARRFRGVTEVLDEGQIMIIDDTTKTLTEMYHKSTQHLDGLLVLEKNYASQCTKITSGIHDYHKAAQQANQCFKDILIERSARSLSRKFPPKLILKVPTNISNPSTRP